MPLTKSQMAHLARLAQYNPDKDESLRSPEDNNAISNYYNQLIDENSSHIEEGQHPSEPRSRKTTVDQALADSLKSKTDPDPASEVKGQ